MGYWLDRRHVDVDDKHNAHVLCIKMGIVKRTYGERLAG
jgi:hypothetical protein